MKRLLVCLISVVLVAGVSAKPAEVESQPDGVIFKIGEQHLSVKVLADNIVRVAAAPDRAYFEKASLAALPQKRFQGRWLLMSNGNDAVVVTPELRVHIDRTTGAVRFHDKDDRPVLAERGDGRSLTPSEVQGEKVLQVRQCWEPAADEALYGLGQHQSGLMDIKGRDLDLWQRNTEIAVPFLVSSRGFGIFWDQTSRTRFGDLRDPEAIPAAVLQDSDGNSGALTATYFADGEFKTQIETSRSEAIDIAVPENVPDRNQRINPKFPAKGAVSVRWSGSILPKETGDYTLWPFYNAGLKIWVDDQLVVDHWRQGWLPWFDQARVHLEKGKRHAVRIDWVVDQNEPQFKLLWKTPSKENAIALWSEVADGLDYTFVYGPSIDRVIAGYRQLTGPAPMLPIWAFGLWQSRERYRTQQESIDIAAKYRELGAPLDVIVQDWFYWRAPEWGSHEFDEKRFPNPVGWIKTLHEKYNTRLLISVWPKFHEGTRNFEEMKSHGFLFQPNLTERIKDWVGYYHTFYDAFNPQARQLFWAQMNRELFQKDVDAWWLDASEPEMRHTASLEDLRRTMTPNALGTGSRVLLAFPLLNARGVYEGQRAAAPNQRVCILTRSGYAGLQHYGAAVWSGDITSTWTALRKQIPAGLSAGLSGLPYWTTDSGGFAVPQRWSKNDGSESVAPTASLMTPADAEEWAELNTRWLQFATFCPLMRIHGQFPFREIWQFGGTESAAFKTQLKFDKLRYRLLPYIYSIAGSIAQDGGTLMRPLVMDFPGDRKAREIGDQFMFGSALLVSPVTQYRVRSRPVYLPSTAGGWYDFWSGRPVQVGQVLGAAAPFETIPVHVRAGSILPLGPEKQFTTEKPADPITLFIYAGADGAFTLYEDDGVSYGYERGEFARIPISWNDATHMLTMGAREGSFPGMLQNRTFEIVLVTPQKPGGVLPTPRAQQTISYSGETLKVQIK
ncbi:MAG: glycoside hydrolase family 31 protein [Nibricoccus sp.]